MHRRRRQLPHSSPPSFGGRRARLCGNVRLAFAPMSDNGYMPLTTNLTMRRLVLAKLVAGVALGASL